MPAFRKDSIDFRQFDSKFGKAQVASLGDLGDLGQFGVILEILEPGAWSSIKHWHSAEDEFVYVLDGRITLHEGDTSSELAPGDVASFRAGDALGHTFENQSDRPATLLVVGTRAEKDVVTYPDHDRVLTRDSGQGTWTDHQGNPASNPYQ